MATGLFDDRYAIGAPLGSGAFGQVFHAIDTNQSMPVALKIFRPGSPVIHAYYEASILTALAGEHVLQVFNADTYVDIPYVATRIAAERSAEDKLQLMPLGVRPDLALRWIRHLLVGLGSCHAHGLIHRDIKPGNLFLDRLDWGLLGDFGLAHPMDANGLVPVGGDLRVAAPELFTAGAGDIRADIYAVGVTFYRLLTGNWPYDGADAAEIQTAVLARGHQPLRDAAPHVSRRLAERIERALAQDPADRYPTAMDMNDEIGRVGLVARTWTRVPSHSGHAICWAEHGASHSLHSVCTKEAAQSIFEIETRRTTGAGTRARDFCFSGVPRAKFLPRLRMIFDRISGFAK